MYTYYVSSIRYPDNSSDLVYSSTPPDPYGGLRIRAAWRVEAPAPLLDDSVTAIVLARLADQYVGSDITVTRVIPREPTADERLDAARNILRADYWADVRNVADDIRAAVRSGELSDTDAIVEYLDETVDGHSRVIYTREAAECLLFSDNDGAYYSEFGTLPDCDGDMLPFSTLACSAFRADILDALGDLDELLVERAPVCYFCDRAFTDDDATEIEEYGGELRRTHVECPEDRNDDNEEDSDDAAD